MVLIVKIEVVDNQARRRVVGAARPGRIPMHGLPYPDLPKALHPIVAAMPDLIELDDLAFAALVGFLNSNPRVRLVPSVVMHEPGGRDKYNRARELHRHLLAIRAFNELRRQSGIPTPPVPPSQKVPEPVEVETPPPTRRRGRPSTSDRVADGKLYAKWKTGQYRTYAELAGRDMTAEDARRAVDRYDKHLKRQKKKHREW